MRTLLRFACAVAAVVAIAALALVAPPPAVAAATDGTLTVTVIRDINADGVQTYTTTGNDRAPLEPGIPGVEIVITDPIGGSVTIVTNANGVATFNGATSSLVGGKYRVEVKNPQPGVLWPAFASTGTTPNAARLSSNEEFVDISSRKNVSMMAGFWLPGLYCQPNPTIINLCQPGMNGNGTGYVDGRTMVTAKYRMDWYVDKAFTTPGVSQMSMLTGSGLYGQGVRRQISGVDNRFLIYTGAYAKRGTKYSQWGPGAIFVSTTTNADVPPNNTQLFAVVPDAGTTAHEVSPSSGSQDLPFVEVPGTEALGDLDVSKDGRFLFVVNMANKKLYVYDASAPAGNAPVLKALDIPSQCADPTEWRPMGLGERDVSQADGLLYIGGVCSQTLTSQVTTMRIGTAPDLSDMVMTGQNVLNQTLTYPRAASNTLGSDCPAAMWRPWQIISAVCRGAQVTWAQPMFGDIEFRNDGEMLVSMRDRSADMYGYGLKIRLNGDYPNIVPAGDLNLACFNGTTYVLDVNGGCGTPREVFNEDTRVGGIHQETYYSGIVYIPSEAGVVTNTVDPSGVAYVDGMTNANAYTGVEIGSTTLISGGSFAKGQGVGDIEALCNNAPIQIGNRVWYDRDRDGIQGPDEIPLPNIKVDLLKDGVVIATTTTNARGEYYFSSLTVAALNPDGGDYDVRFVKPTTGTVNLGVDGTRQWTAMSFTTPGVGPNRLIDSNPDPTTGITRFTAGGPGQDNHSLDAGFIITPPAQPVYAKTSTPTPGSVVKPGDTISYTVTATNPTATAITAATVTDNMAQALDKATLTPANATPQLTCVGGTQCGALTYNATAKTFTWNATTAAPLAANVTARITYTVTVNPGVTGSVINNLVEPNITTNHPIITWDKVATPASGTLVKPGDNVTYTISVRNTGTITSNSFSVFDDLSDVVDNADIDVASITITPAGLGSASYDATTKRLTWTGALTAAGTPTAEARVSYTVKVKEGTTGELRNHYFDKVVINPVAVALTWNKVDPRGVKLAGSEWSLQLLNAQGQPTGSAATVPDCVAQTAAACTGVDKNPNAGEFRVTGLAPGTYRLTETKAPVGFILTSAPIQISLLANQAVTAWPDIVNRQQGVPDLPLTGGLGTDQVVLAGGGFLAISVLAYLLNVRRRRRV